LVVQLDRGDATALEVDDVPARSAAPSVPATEMERRAAAERAVGNQRATAAERVASFRATLGSEAAFRGFYDEALPRVYGYLLPRCRGERALAEDLTQTAFGEAIRQRASFDGRSEPITWLIGIARHKLLDHLRAQEREERKRIHLVVREIAMDHETATWRNLDERQVLLANLGRLTAMQRAVLILHYADDLPVREVAREIGRSESATESLLTRARDALRDAYEESTDD
jgi:RNA polymerase sigma-70 factor (ECF subfamily)